MSKVIELRVCTVIAEILDVPTDNIRAETQLSLGDLGWKGFLTIALELEREFDIVLPIEVPNSWTTVADVAAAVETAIDRVQPAKGEAA